MKSGTARFVFSGLLTACLALHALAQVPANKDTIYISGDTFHGRENAGLMEATINGDTNSTGARINPNRVYALNEGQYYHQLAPIDVNNPTGTLTIAGVPSAHGTTKPVIFITNTGASQVGVSYSATNQVYGSLRFDNIYYVVMELDGHLNADLFLCGTRNRLPQSLSIDNCLFEFSNIDLFDCTNETGAIGGWPYGAKFRLTNSYFRNLFYPGQWWGSRVFQCKHPIDTLWIENCTVTTGGLTFLQQNELTDFMYFNHNTIVNNKKYWFLSTNHKSMYVTNNIFINQNWVGEDTNVTNSGSSPDKSHHSTINIDTNSTWNGLVVQGRYYAADSIRFVPALDLNRLQIYVSDNINYYDSLLIKGYYNSNKYRLASINALPSYLTWFGYPNPPFPIFNVPGEWMNTRTLGLFKSYSPPHGGFIERRTSTDNPNTVTPGIADASIVDSMAVWNQNQWGDPRFPDGAALQNTGYIYGDYDPTTLPGIVNGVKTDKDTTDGAGITKFTDLTENFSQSTHLSAIDGLPIGSLIWDDAKLASYNSAAAWTMVYNKYIAEGGLTSAGGTGQGVPESFSLLQNYPNPVNPATTIGYSLPRALHVTLSVYNVLGQLVSVLVNGTQTAGYHEVVFNAANLSSGVYFYRIAAGDYFKVKKMIVEK